jgi:protein SCO1/2
MQTSTSSNRSAPAHPLLTIATAALVILLGCLALHQATMGFQVVSTEDGRRLEVARHPRAIPHASIDWPTRPLLADVLRADGRVAVISFIYTSCNAVCSALGSEFQRMQAQIRAQGLQRKVRLLSISFDPRDNLSRLSAYAERQHADKRLWQFAGMNDDNERKAVLETFGVVVVAAPLGEFEHNAAFHLVDASGRLMKIIDYDAPDRALADAVALYDAGIR